MGFLDSFPNHHTEGYSVCAGQLEGEAALGRIAANSTREYLWTFEEWGKVWENHPVRVSSKRSYRGQALRSETQTATIPRSLTRTYVPGTSIYHNHPPTDIDDGVMDIKNQLPSNPDIAACVSLCLNGYHDFRIATGLGITTLRLSQEALEQRSARIRGLVLEREAMLRWKREMGTTAAIHQATDYFTNRMGGQLVMSFRPFDSPAEANDL